MLKSIKQSIPRDLKIELVYRAIRLRGMLDFGDAVECNICNKSFGRFADFNRRINVLCPHCFSLERHRLQFEYLRQHTGIFKDPLRVLHFAPEKCLHDRIAKNVSLEYHTADLMTHFIDLIEVRPRHRMSVTEIDFSDDYFDMVICNHLLEHVKDDLRAMAELYRVLKPAGLCLAQVPINLKSDEVLEDFTLSEAQRAILYGSPHHVRYYSERGFTERLRSVGFTVEVNQLCEALEYGRLRLMRSENLYIMRKPKFEATSEAACSGRKCEQPAT